MSGSVHVWTSDGRRWNRPVVLDGARLAGPLAVSRQVNGRVRLFGIRLEDFHLVTAEQTAPNVDRFTGWLDLGNSDLNRPAEMGSPESAVDGTGRLYVFVKAFAGGVSVRSLSPAGVWESWQGIGGTGVTESLATAVDALGRIDLYAPAAAGILRWTQPYAGGPIVLQPGVVAPVPAGRLSAIANADGRPQVFYRDPQTGGVYTVWQTRDESWAGPLSLGGEDTLGPVTTAVADGRIVVVALSTVDDLRQVRQAAPNTSFPPGWTDLPGTILSAPEAGVDPTGRLVIGFVGETGALSFDRAGLRRLHRPRKCLSRRRSGDGRVPVDKYRPYGARRLWSRMSEPSPSHGSPIFLAVSLFASAGCSFLDDPGDDLRDSDGGPDTVLRDRDVHRSVLRVQADPTLTAWAGLLERGWVCGRVVAWSATGMDGHEARPRHGPERGPGARYGPGPRSGDGIGVEFAGQRGRTRRRRTGSGPSRQLQLPRHQRAPSDV